jgi:hypothetical protein
MNTKYKHETFVLESQDGNGEETFLHIDETPEGTISITVSGEEEPHVFIETFCEEIRILIDNDYEDEPEIIVLPSIAGSW